MRAEKYKRLKAGIISGLLACGVLGAILLLVGYTTPYKLAMAWISVAAVGFGLIAGAQAYISNPEDPAPPEGPLAELERLAESKALGASTKPANKQKTS